PGDRRSAVCRGGDNEKTGLTEQASAWVVLLKGYAPELASANIRNSVVPRQAFIHECVIGVKDVHDAAILAHDRVKHEFGFAADGLPEVLVEVVRFRLGVLEISQ